MRFKQDEIGTDAAAVEGKAFEVADDVGDAGAVVAEDFNLASGVTCLDYLIEGVGIDDHAMTQSGSGGDYGYFTK